MSKVWYQSFLFSLAVGLAFASQEQVEAASLEEEFQRVATVVKESIQGATTIDVRAFTDINAQTEVSGRIAPGLQAQFLEACEKLGVRQNDQADHVLLATFSVNDRKSIEADDPIVLEVEFSLKTRRGRSPVEIAPIRVDSPKLPTVKIDEPNVLGEALGVNGMVTTKANVDASPSDLSREQLARLALTPTGFASEAKIKSNAGSKIEVQIVSRRAGSSGDFQPLSAVVKQGQPFVSIPLGHEYKIQVTNHGTLPFAVATSIDGLSVFHFADDTCRDPNTKRLAIKHQLVRAGEANAEGQVIPMTTTLPGWILSATGANNSARFLVSSYGNSNSPEVRFPRPPHAGAIHLQFFPCRLVTGNLRDPDATKFTTPGERETIGYERAEVTATAPSEFLTIRYDR
ncbi:hypothetical protein LOC68_00960 [Blastopirellula sp. JC732]|uniref:Uncharacterized protein n=1 Tax=Blastopirellula sediminis TaxID=2894196 RepID=A0A9X1MHA1_9BACT|nr:hypothetical protein [Blastopirellula sediminis]MCC9608243.1 hypothetical protein [Blastopirellula sediminis]MCC9626964.1 hypothetical protein [Blastopirellula sediminis]